MAGGFDSVKPPTIQTTLFEQVQLPFRSRPPHSDSVVAGDFDAEHGRDQFGPVLVIERSATTVVDQRTEKPIAAVDSAASRGKMAQQIGGSLNLACRTDLSVPASLAHRPLRGIDETQNRAKFDQHDHEFSRIHLPVFGVSYLGGRRGRLDGDVGFRHQFDFHVAALEIPVEEVLRQGNDGRFAERRAAVAGTGQCLQPHIHAFGFQGGLQFHTLSVRNQRVVRAVQDQHRRIVFADIVDRTDDVGLLFVVNETLADQLIGHRNFRR